jgi:tetratricopeptide (TPR) repeat protein
MRELKRKPGKHTFLLALLVGLIFSIALFGCSSSENNSVHPVFSELSNNKEIPKDLKKRIEKAEAAFSTYEASGNEAELRNSIALLEKARDSHPGHFSPLLTLANLYENASLPGNDRFYKARDFAAAASVADPEHPAPYRILARMALALESDSGKAIGFYEKSVAYDPGHLPTMTELGTCYLHDNQLKKAEQVLVKALDSAEKDPADLDRIRAEEILARVYTSTGRYGKAERLLGNSVAGLKEAQDSGDEEAEKYICPFQAFGVLYLATGRPGKAIDAMKKVAAMQPTSKRFSDVAITAFNYGDYNTARAYNEKAKQATQHPEQQIMDGFLELASGKAQEARTTFRNLAETPKAAVGAKIGLAHLDLSEGRSAAAETTFVEALESLPEGLECEVERYPCFFRETALLGLGWARAQQDRNQEALKLFQRLVQATPNHPIGLTAMGSTLFRLGRNDEAVAAFKKILVNSQQHSIVQSALAAAEKDTAEPKEIGEIFTKGPFELSVRPAGSTIKLRKLLELARLRIEQKQFDQAEALLEKALASSPNNAEAAQLLAEIQAERANSN